jgi:hypothetical protein
MTDRVVPLFFSLWQELGVGWLRWGRTNAIRPYGVDDWAGFALGGRMRFVPTMDFCPMKKGPIGDRAPFLIDE